MFVFYMYVGNHPRGRKFRNVKVLFSSIFFLLKFKSINYISGTCWKAPRELQGQL